ncbi:hypothetical protein QAD02_013159 [Eretmocerus hayati]|uniref:Uncharacterized protein n=1 Tax=Eretmocerus hayati TaxID=131215 RepID=A0ACC2P1W4_9HYME|nr:hypothetical protein QAD02_013159 [Eretmocerus hayati]
MPALLLVSSSSGYALFPPASSGNDSMVDNYLAIPVFCCAEECVALLDPVAAEEAFDLSWHTYLDARPLSLMTDIFQDIKRLQDKLAVCQACQLYSRIQKFSSAPPGDDSTVVNCLAVLVLHFAEECMALLHLGAAQGALVL